ncbi:hypothetical protein [Mesobacterium pallidum]|uniref:hypothetical protein n=1 Tax=Mesobacterium pallidum TaxID=2872037 RepID=UPI001EE392D6|nr:hypothetical protein [Mesobacterium pallidum]
MRIAIFGHGAPIGVLGAIGVTAHDVTLCEAPAGTAADRYIEPFMDPFATSVLRGMAAGALDEFAAILFLRESPGAMHACLYAHELARRGVMPNAAPNAIMLNILPADDPAAGRFNRAELDRLTRTLTGLGWQAGAARPLSPQLDDLLARQSAGQITGAAAFDARARLAAGGVVDVADAPTAGPRLAILGAPLGNAALHAALDRIGTLALDQQALDQAHAARGVTLDAALSAQAANPFAARQPKAVFVPALAEALKTHQIDRVIWQRDPNDDLWGWLAPQVRDLCAARGIGWTDLGALPRWPTAADIAALTLGEAVA